MRQKSFSCLVPACPGLVERAGDIEVKATYHDLSPRAGSEMCTLPDAIVAAAAPAAQATLLLANNRHLSKVPGIQVACLADYRQKASPV